MILHPFDWRNVHRKLIGAEETFLLISIILVLMNTIIIVGTDPPCPRCGLLTEVVKNLVSELSIEAELRHVTYSTSEARLLAKEFGLKPGTATDVSEATGKAIDSDQMRRYIKEQAGVFHDEFADYNKFNWSPALDEFLKPFEKMAEENGVMMTPVLIINGDKKHQGSVPSLDSIKGWLSDLNS